MSKPLILVIEDEVQIRKLLEVIMKSENYRTITAESALQGIHMAKSHQPDLIMLDLGLPDLNGHETLKRLREWYSKSIIILSVISNEQDIVSALDGGANDYITKPFRTAELLARIRSAIKKDSMKGSAEEYNIRDLHISLEKRIVKKHGEDLKLTKTEYKMLVLFIHHAGSVLTHHFILKEIWGTGFQTNTQYLRVFIGTLRKKIEDNPNQPKYIITENGVGYRFVESEHLS